MKKLLVLFLLVTFLFSFTFSTYALGVDVASVKYNNNDYYEITNKSDYKKLARYMFENRLTELPVYVNLSRCTDYANDDFWFKNISNVDYTTDNLYFKYYQYSQDSIWCGPYNQIYAEGSNQVIAFYGKIEICYNDTDYELQQADLLINKELQKISSYSKVDKIKYIANYICKNVQYGSQKMPDGGYDMINGVYDLMTGVRTNVVCTSYALLFQRFMEKAGYNSYIVTGGNHAWNVVEVDGLWYGVDCTFGDNESGTINTYYLLMGMNVLSEYITPTENVYNEMEKELGCKFANNSYLAKDSNKDSETTRKESSKQTTNNIDSKNPAKDSTSTVVETDKNSSSNNDSKERTTNNENHTIDSSSTYIEDTELDTSINTDTDSSNDQTLDIESESTIKDVQTIDVSKESIVKSEIFSNLGSDSVLVLSGQNYSWSFDSNKLTNNVVDLNTNILLGANNIPKEDIAIIDKIVETKEYFPFEFEYHGELPGEATISIQLDSTFSNKNVCIYSIDSNENAVLEGKGLVSSDGKLSFTTNHCSVWFITETEINSNANWAVIIIIILVVLAIIATIIIVFIKKRKKS